MSAILSQSVYDKEYIDQPLKSSKVASSISKVSLGYIFA